MVIGTTRVVSGTPDGTVELGWCRLDVGRNIEGRSSRGRSWKEGKNQGKGDACFIQIARSATAR